MTRPAGSWLDLLARVLLALAALDFLITGGWLLARPTDLFALLSLPPRDLPLWRLLGVLGVAQGLCLVLTVARPTEWRGVLVFPLAGRLGGAALWWWLLNVDWLPISSAVLTALLFHQAFWLPLFAACLLSGRPR